MNSRFSTNRQCLKLGQLILKQLHPNGSITIAGGPNEPDFHVLDGRDQYNYDMKLRDEDYPDLLLEYGNLQRDRRFFSGWLFKNPDWRILYVFERSGRWYSWSQEELLRLLTSKRLPLTQHVSSQKENVDYTTLSFGVEPRVLKDFLSSFREGNWKFDKWPEALPA